jgi:hypothetical protein
MKTDRLLLLAGLMLAGNAAYAQAEPPQPNSQQFAVAKQSLIDRLSSVLQCAKDAKDYPTLEACRQRAPHGGEGTMREGEQPPVPRKP